jgi:hypothetical protein
MRRRKGKKGRRNGKVWLFSDDEPSSDEAPFLLLYYHGRKHWDTTLMKTIPSRQRLTVPHIFSYLQNV